MKNEDREEQQMVWLRQVTALLDDRFRLPGTDVRLGLDALIGLAPGVGDVVGFAVSGVLVLHMVRYGASGMLIVKMLWNALLDALLGAIPLLGIFFDIGFRANRRNLRLLEEHYEEGKHQGSAWWVVALVLVVVLALLGLLVYLLARGLGWFVGLFG